MAQGATPITATPVRGKVWGPWQGARRALEIARGGGLLLYDFSTKK